MTEKKALRKLIRQQIADGSYAVDADRIADALMTMEKELL